MKFEENGSAVFLGFLFLVLLFVLVMGVIGLIKVLGWWSLLVFPVVLLSWAVGIVFLNWMDRTEKR